MFPKIIGYTPEAMEEALGITEEELSSLLKKGKIKMISVIPEQELRRMLRLLANECTIKEAAKKAGVGNSTVNYWIRNGLLPATKKGRGYYIKNEDLRRFLDDRNRRNIGYSFEEAASKLNVSHSTIWNWYKRGLLPATKIAGAYWISKEDLAKFIKGDKRPKMGRKRKVKMIAFRLFTPGSIRSSKLVSLTQEALNPILRKQFELSLPWFENCEYACIGVSQHFSETLDLVVTKLHYCCKNSSIPYHQIENQPGNNHYGPGGCSQRRGLWEASGKMVVCICDNLAGTAIKSETKRYCKNCPAHTTRKGDTENALLRILLAIQKKADPSDTVNELRRRWEKND